MPKDDKNSITKKKRKIDKTPRKNNSSQKTVTDIFSPSKQGNTSQMVEENATTLQSNGTDVILEAWNNFCLQQPLLEALKDLQFTQPTEIQALTLPAAILGKFLDIL